MSVRQKTLGETVTLRGTGLHTGSAVELAFKPAEPNSGIRFVRTDVKGGVEIPAVVESVVDIARATVLGVDGVRVHTVEHVLAALIGCAVDNTIIELNGEEPPALDGSALPFMEAIRSAGTVEQDATREYLELDKTLSYRDAKAGVDIVIVPSSEFRVTYMIDYEHASIGTQYTSMYSLDEFEKEFAPARTFCLLSETEPLKEAGLIRGGNLDNAVVFVDREIGDSELVRLRTMFNVPHALKLGKTTLDNRPLRFANEPVRHKTLDLVGDLALVGVPIRGHVLAARGGHRSHIEVAKLLRKVYESQRVAKKYGSKLGQGYVFDSASIEKLLPHRYPMLLVDRILE